MAVKLKPVTEQVVVIVGASSGSGRESAKRFSRKGATLEVAARDEQALATLVQEIEAEGGEATYHRCDATNHDDVKAVGRLAEARFGRIDTWVNDAAVSVYGRFWETTHEEFRRVMEINYLGQIHGCLVALAALRRAGGGSIIAISSVESMVSLPLHSAYSASKHAVEGAMDALRRELIANGDAISVTSIKPATIDTPFFNNSRNKMDVKPKGPSPIYDPGVVADCVLYAAAHPVRDLFAGGAARMMVGAQRSMPGMVDRILARTGIPASRTDEPRLDGAEGNLYDFRDDDRTAGDFTTKSRRSAYTWVETHPSAKLFVAAGALAGAALLAQRRRSRSGTVAVVRPAIPLLPAHEELVIDGTDVMVIEPGQ